MLAQTVGAKYAVSCSSGTAALHLSLMALDLHKGDTVIVPANTFVATANAVRMCGAEVLFTDVDPNSGLMGAEHIEEALRSPDASNIRAIIPVHFAGQCSDPRSISNIAIRLNVPVVEDACHALGATYEVGEEVLPIGSCAESLMCTFSFHPVKAIAMGEGGAITTNNQALATRLSELRSHGLVRKQNHSLLAPVDQEDCSDESSWSYQLSEIGPNYRASDIHCALGRSQLKKLKKFIETRRNLAKYYTESLKKFHPIIRPLVQIPAGHSAWHLYVVLIDFNLLKPRREEIMEELQREGIGTQIHYIPVPWQPYYRARYPNLTLPGCSAYYKRCLSLPLFPSMSIADVEKVVVALGRVIGKLNV